MYDFESAKVNTVAQRRGAFKTFEDKKGLCIDFTDLFIALTRSVGIPSREIDGYAYAKDLTSTPIKQIDGRSDFLHSWVQYYDPQNGWISVDPTWGTTSGLDYFSRLDNNHLALVIKGSNSQYPQPPEEINVDFSHDDFFSKESSYDLERLSQSNVSEIELWMVLSFAGVLGLCTTLVLVKALSKGR